MSFRCHNMLNFRKMETRGLLRLHSHKLISYENVRSDTKDKWLLEDLKKNPRLFWLSSSIIPSLHIHNILVS